MSSAASDDRDGWVEGADNIMRQEQPGDAAFDASIQPRGATGGSKRRPPQLLPLLLEACLLLAGLYVMWLLASGSHTDNGIGIFRHYALDFWFGVPADRHHAVIPPFHALPMEYPPLALLPFSLTLLPRIAQSHQLYAGWLAAVSLLGYLAIRRFAGVRRAWLYAVYLFVGATASLLVSFDLFPALATLAALWAAQRRRFTWAYVFLALGILLKLYPLFLLPILLAEHARVILAATPSVFVPVRLPYTTRQDTAAHIPQWVVSGFGESW